MANPEKELESFIYAHEKEFEAVKEIREDLISKLAQATILSGESIFDTSVRIEFQCGYQGKNLRETADFITQIKKASEQLSGTPESIDPVDWNQGVYFNGIGFRRLILTNIPEDSVLRENKKDFDWFVRIILNEIIGT